MKFLYYIYLILFAVPTLLLVTFLACSTTIIGTAICGDGWFSHYPAMIWSRLMCWLTLVRVEVRRNPEVDRKTSYVFVANHQSAYDIFAVYGWLGHRFKWMMKISLRKTPLIGFTCARAGHIFVDRSSASAVRHTIENAEKTLQGGMSIVVFPEGSRTLTGKMGPFKKGAYQLALEFGLPLVPVTIDGAYNVMKPFTKVPHTGKIILTIHKPIAPPVSEADRAEVMEHTRNIIQSTLPE